MAIVHYTDPSRFRPFVRALAPAPRRSRRKSYTFTLNLEPDDGSFSEAVNWWLRDESRALSRRADDGGRVP